MKRMSEVFELPVSVSLMGDEHAGEITKGDYPHYCLEDNNYWMLSDFEHAQHAAHAINHVDALANALEGLLKATDGYSAWWAKEHKNATDAIAEYQGDK